MKPFRFPSLGSLVLLAVFGWCLGQAPLASAGPFQKIISFVQADGTPIQVSGQGDEFSAVFETLDGYTVVFDTTRRSYCYARPDADGTLASTGVTVPVADPSALGLTRHVRMSAAARKAMVVARYQRWEQVMQTQARWQGLKAAQQQRDAQVAAGLQPSPPNVPTVGNKMGLTLLVDFSDDVATIPQAEIVNFCNGDNYTGFGNNGSVKSYFRDNSGGLLIYSNVVTIYIRAPRPKTYYNDTTKDCGDQANLLIKDALDTMKALPNYTTQILPTFAPLTVDGNNEVVACNVFYTGDNGGRWMYGLWPHSWGLYVAGAQELSTGGKKVFRYQVTDIGAQLELGTFCHENGHMLCGYPDIYDYEYDSVGGAGVFCLMNSGGHGQNPNQICAYLKRASGWGTTTELNYTSYVTPTLSAAAGTNFNRFYRYAKPGVATEYYLVEIRNRSGRDASLPCSGIAIWHIDELGDKDIQSMLPNTLHRNYEVTLMQADNLWHFQNNDNGGDASDLFFNGNAAAGYRNEISDFTPLASHWWDGSRSGFAARRFSAAAPQMSLVIGGLPIILSQPQSQSSQVGGTVTFSAAADGASTLGYYWRLNGLPIPGATGSNLTLVNVQGSQAGNYTFVATNGYGGVTSVVANLQLVIPLLAEAVDSTNLMWLTYGSSAWFYETNLTHDGVDAAQSGAVGHGQETWLETRIVGPGVVSYWSKISSQAGSDYLEFYTNGVLQPGRISGLVDWQKTTLEVAPGTNVLRWRYRKDAAGSSGQDCAWVDQVNYVPDSGPPIFKQHPRSRLVSLGGATSFSALATGAWPLRYQWRLNGVNLPGATNTTLNLNNLQPSQAGLYSVLATNSVGSAVSSNAVLSIMARAGGYDTPGYAYGVSVIGQWAYVADGSAGLEVFDVSNPLRPALVGTNDTSGYSYAVQVSGRYACVADGSAGVQVLDVSNPQHPVRVGTCPLPGAVYALEVAGHLAYVADGDAGLRIVDFSSPTAPVAVGGLDTVGFATGIDVHGSYAYLADGAAGLEIINISQPTNPVLVASFATAGLAEAVRTDGRYAYVAEGAVGLQVVDVSDPANPVLVGAYDSPGSASAVQLFDNYAYVADGASGLLVLDVTDPAQPVKAGSYDTSGFTADVQLSGPYAYLADGSAGLVILAAVPVAGGVPQVVVPPYDQWVVSGGPAVFSVSVIGAAPFSYQWQQEGFPLPGATNAWLPLPSVFAAQAGDYTVTVSNALGYVISSPGTLTVQDVTVTVGSALSGGSIPISFYALPGVTYVVEYKDSLSSTLWMTLETVVGTGAMVEVTDPRLSNPAQRFYRVRVDY